MPTIDVEMRNGQRSSEPHTSKEAGPECESLFSEFRDLSVMVDMAIGCVDYL